MYKFGFNHISVDGSGFSCAQKPASIIQLSKMDWARHMFILPFRIPLLLTMDNHSNHASNWSYNFCQINGIIVVSVPPHTPQRMQPLGISSFETLKSAYNRECRLFMRSHPYEKIHKEEISLLNTACKHCCHCKGRVRVCSSIYPLNPDTFSEDDFISVEVPTTGTETV